MKIELIKMAIENFKGIRSFILEPKGKSMNIHGANGTGKTTLLDAFTWCLFDKNGEGQKSFEIKTIINDEPVHNLNHSVEIMLSLDGSDLSLKKIYKEKWTKKRGQLHQEFTGHETDYLIDGVPSKKKEYEDKIKSIIDEDTFKSITSTSHFGSLDWKKRREIVMKIVGEPSNDDIFKSDPSVKDIVSISDIDGRKKILDAKRKEINKTLDSIPTRIDELHKHVIESDSTVTEKDRDDIQSQIDEISSRIANLTIDGENQKLEIEKNKLTDEVTRLKRYVADFDQFKANFERDKINKISKYNAAIKDLQSKNEKLRTEHKSTFSQKAELMELCPTCGQDIPEEKRQEAIEQFNVQKSIDLERISKAGNANNVLIEDLKKDIETENKQVARDHYHFEIPEQETITDLQAKINDLSEKIKSSVNEEIETKKSDLENNRSGLRKQLADINTALAKVKGLEATKNRIDELEKEQIELSKQFGEVEKELNLIERYTRAKMSLVQDRIQGKFKLAKFRMFETQINGGINDVCEILGPDGVPYSTDLNNAMKINVGLDICNVLSENVGINAPIFVDNAESVTDLIESDSQIIRLVVDRECCGLTAVSF